MAKVNNSIKYHLAKVAKKLLNLRDNKRLRNSDKEIVDEILDTDIPLIQELLREKKN